MWLGLDRWLTIFLIEIVQVWQITPLSRADHPRGAAVDPAGPVRGGAGGRRRARGRSFRRISLPLIRPALAVAAVQALVLSLNIFDQVYVLNGIAPLGSSVMLQTYVTTFQNLNFGGGYALSLLVTVATAVLSMARSRCSTAGRRPCDAGGGVMAEAGTRERTLAGRDPGRGRPAAGRCGRPARAAGLGRGDRGDLILLWSLFPIYWALNTSLTTLSGADSRARALRPVAAGRHQLPARCSASAVRAPGSPASSGGRC